MRSKIYNNDEQKFDQLIQDLKGLPKERAEENFEFNLMVKIRNKNFDLSTPEKTYFFSKRVIPATVFAFSLIVIFFVVSEPGTSLENPLFSEPPVRENYSHSKVDTIELSQPQMAAVSTQLTNQTAQKEVEKPSENVVRVVVEPSDAITVEQVELPFDDSNSLDLDSYVKGEKTQNSTMSRGRIVSGGQASQFDGFLVREKASKEAIQAHKAMCDSLKKAQKADKK